MEEEKQEEFVNLVFVQVFPSNKNNQVVLDRDWGAEMSRGVGSCF